MTRRLLGVLLWLVLLPLLGTGRLLWRLLAALSRLRPQTLLTAVGLVVALSTPNPIRDQLAQAGIWPPGHGMLVRGLWMLSIGVLYHGLRSPMLRRVERRLMRGRV